MTPNTNFKINNFDLIRLFAATQVAFLHTLTHLKIDEKSIALQILNLFPGVPIFFFISGFLISRSFENSRNLRDYSKNRILRIYPALIVCSIFGLISVQLTGYFSESKPTITQIATWFLGQVSFIQFYNPDFMRGYGVGVLNGSLWTISVELQFYIALPILYVSVIAAKNHLVSNTARLCIVTLIFLSVALAYKYLASSSNLNPFYKLAGVTFLPWFYMFLLGVIFQRNFDTIYDLLKGKFSIVLILYVVLGYVTTTYLGWTVGNTINPLLFLLLATLIFSTAYTAPKLCSKLLYKNDISYGIYIYHMPVINLLIATHYQSSINQVALVMLITFFLAILSWVLIERPAIRLKRTSIY